MVELPTGTVTFLFTDIEGSTRLLKQLRGRADEILAEHQRLLRQSFEVHRGREIDMHGDSSLVAFARAWSPAMMLWRRSSKLAGCAYLGSRFSKLERARCADGLGDHRIDRQRVGDLIVTQPQSCATC